MKPHRHLKVRVAVVMAVVAVAMLVATAPALAANSIYWGDESESTIAFANLDGSGGSNIPTPGATANEILGTAIDPMTDKIYWANFGGRISSAILDGSGATDLAITGAMVFEPFGLAIDTGAGKLYWANTGNNTIAFANLNGSGGGTLNTAGATVENTAGVAIDPTEGRIYWANFKAGAGSISYANLNGTGGGNVNTTGAPVVGPEGIAIDPVARRIYWGNYNGGTTIGFANLNGTGGGTLNTTGARVESPAGIAIDPVAGRIYWANSTNPGGGISYANLNGTGGGGNLPTGTAKVDDPAFPSLLEAPSAAGAPTIGGGSTTGSTLGCSQGSWAPDVISEFFYRSPQTYSYAWQLNNAEIGGASGQTFTPTQPGLYSCRVTGTNHAGSSAQTSSAVQISSAPGSPRVAAVISHAGETHKTWREGNRLAHISKTMKKKPPVGTTFSFTLNERASVSFTFTQRVGGRTVNGKCVAQTKKNGHRHACKRTVTRGTMTFTGHPGTNKVTFQGRISRSKKLSPGTYMLIIGATNAAGQRSIPSSLGFVIVR